jgi:AraC-like DNA-binding protein
MEKFKQLIVFFSPSVPVYVAWLREKTAGSYPLGCHPEYEFHFIKCGRGAYYIDGKTWSFGPRSLVIIRPNQIHSFIPEPDVAMEKAQILFQGEWLGSFLWSLNIDKNFPSLISLSDFSALHIETILNRILEENLRRDKGWEGMIREQLRDFLLWVIRANKKLAEPRKANPLFVQMRQYMESHFTEPQCNVTLVAKKFGYSLNYLSTLFKEACGIGLKTYLLQRRIIAARKIIDKNQDLKIEAVARQAGFNQYRNFARTFFRLTGFSAAAYRKKRHVHRKK